MPPPLTTENSGPITGLSKPSYSTSITERSDNCLHYSPKKKKVTLDRKLQVVYVQSYKKYNEIPQKSKNNEIKCQCMVF